MDKSSNSNFNVLIGKNKHFFHQLHNYLLLEVGLRLEIATKYFEVCDWNVTKPVQNLRENTFSRHSFSSTVAREDSIPDQKYF